MSQEQSQAAPDSSSTRTKSNADWFLQLLVKLVNGKDDIAFPVTLNVGGVMISGEIVSGHRYFEGFAKELREGFFGTDSEDGSDMESSIRKLGNIYTQNLPEQEREEDELLPPNFIHLRNARVFHPAGKPIPDNKGVWWRGRLEAVDGFILGTLSAN